MIKTIIIVIAAVIALFATVVGLRNAMHGSIEVAILMHSIQILFVIVIIWEIFGSYWDMFLDIVFY